MLGQIDKYRETCTLASSNLGSQGESKVGYNLRSEF